MGYRYAIAPQPGELVTPTHDQIPGGQRCIVQRVDAYQPDTNAWSVTLAYEHNAHGRASHITATSVSGRWLEVEL
jgi:hypothetical protein